MPLCTKILTGGIQAKSVFTKKRKINSIMREKFGGVIWVLILVLNKTVLKLNIAAQYSFLPV